MGVVLPVLVWGLGASAESVTIEVRSSIDGTDQPCGFVASDKPGPQPMLVLLHPWSHGYHTYDLSDWVAEATRRGWHVLQPDFRGPNCTPDACASPKARQDIVDAVALACERYAVDKDRVFVAGASGGGHMAMVMAAHVPGLWAAASASCGISDLAAWHAESKAAGSKYCMDIEATVGGAPGTSKAVDAELRYRSPVHHMAAAKNLPIDIATGIHDGHTGSVPIHHSIDAFNAIAKALGAPGVTENELRTLSDGKPLATDEEQDASFGRQIYLRRYAGPSRLTIFEGGHEGVPAAVCAWLENHCRNATR